MTRNEKIDHAFEHFNEHKAQRQTSGIGIEVVDWRRPGTREYAIRFVFDREGGAIYITGDLGEAVAYPTWPATLEDTAKAVASRWHCVNERYFLEKVKAASDRYEYDRDEAIADIRHFAPDISDDDLDDVMHDFDERWGMERISDGAAEKLAGHDGDYWEWIAGAGRSIALRVYLWLVGLAMAWEQLNNDKQEGAEE